MQDAGLPVPVLHENTGCVLMTFKLPERRVGVNVGANGGVNALVVLIKQRSVSVSRFMDSTSNTSLLFCPDFCTLTA